LIPPNWISHPLDEIQLEDPENIQRTDLHFRKDDPVRKEIEIALDAKIPIIPILLNGAIKPANAKLPESIRSLFDVYNLANEGKPLFFNDPNIDAFQKLFEQIAETAGLHIQPIADPNLFRAPLDQDFPLPRQLQLLPDVKVPFVGLKPFTREDTRIFFGRSREIYDLCYKLIHKPAARIILLDGYSGTGKSSLLQAGLIPRIEGAHWTVAYRRREEDKIQGLPGVLQQLLADVAAAPAGKKLLILDQVEEAITDRIEGLPQELELFAAALQQAFLDHSEYTFLLGFRSEQKARIEKALQSARLPFDAENTLQPLDLAGVLEAISGVASNQDLQKHYNFQFSPPELCKHLAGRLYKGWDHYHVAPLLQVNMEMLWQRCGQPDGSVIITAANIEGLIERQDSLLDHYLQKIREKISTGKADDQKLMQLLHFYVQDEPASATRLDTEFAVDENFKSDAAFFTGLQQELKNHYLLTEVISKGQSATRLSHDVLARVIHERHQSATEAKLKETSEGYFDALKKDVAGQIYRLEYPAAMATLQQMIQLGIRRDELQPFLMELMFFWNESGLKKEVDKIVSLCLENNLMAEAMQGNLRLLASQFDKHAIRRWLQTLAPGTYADLCNKYLAPTDTVMIQIPGGSLRIGEEEEARQAEVRTFRLANVPTTWWKYGLYLFAQGQEKQLAEKAPSWGINGDHPMVHISWYEAVSYCNWLSEAMGLEKAYDIRDDVPDDGNHNENDYIKWLVKPAPQAKGYRLPTEVEWEYAARGGQQSKGFQYAGSNNLDEV
ncbi:MAG TPA: hypothetical protein DCF33_05160, partial [Saprospirales bacterium]|nr:hypothetical protein [Saprospirales bacterium]